MKKLISAILALTLVFALCACGEQEEKEFYLASEMSQEKKENAEAAATEFMRCLEEDDVAAAMKLLSADFGTTEEEMKNFFSQIHDLCENPFVPYDSYYINDVAVSDTVIKIKNSEGDKNYLELTPAAEELYCALYVSEGKNISYMLTVLMAYEDGGFKIVFINPGDFKYAGNDAPAIYQKAKALYDGGDLISAYICSCMIGNTFHPGGYYRFENDTELEDFCYKLYTEVSEKHELPLKLENTANSAVYEIGIAKDDEQGIIPLFLVKSDAKTSDKAAISAEGEKCIDAIKKLAPKFAESFDFARVNMTNDELNENTTTVNSETVTVKVK